MFQWESYVSLGVLLVLIIVIIVPRSVFTKSSLIKLYKEDKRLLFNSDPWPPAEQKLEMPCDNYVKYQGVKEFHMLARIGSYCKIMVFGLFKL